MQNLQDLIREMQSYGLLINENTIVHHKIGRCATRNKPRAKNGWYIIHCSNDLITAFYGDYQKGKQSITWCSKQQLSQQDKKQQYANYLQYQQQINLDKDRKLYIIRNQYEKFSILQSDQPHAYLLNKGISSWLRCSQSDRLKQDQVGNIIMPIRDIDNQLQGYQIIAQTGDKKFVSGTNKKGNFYLLIADGLSIRHCDCLFIGEGLATMVSFYLAMNEYLESYHYACVVACDVNNIEPVLLNIWGRYSGIPVTIIADNDCGATNNIGVETCNAIKNKYCLQHKIDVFIPYLSNGGVA